MLPSTGLLTNSRKIVAAASARNAVLNFNPGDNSNQARKFRVISGESSSSAASISGIHDPGNVGPQNNLTCNLLAGYAKEISAAELEHASSEKGLAGCIDQG